MTAALPLVVPLPRSFYERPTEEVAPQLLGAVIVRRHARRTRLARIVEVEAYLGERDAASHARRGPTPRSAIMFGPPGHLYVYLIYGIHHCMNFVTEREGVAGAVLIRAAEPVAGFDGVADPHPMRGPGKLCAALHVTLADKGLDLTRDDAFFVGTTAGAAPPPAVACSRRVGVDYAGEWARRALRFYIPGNPHVSARPRR